MVFGLWVAVPRLRFFFSTLVYGCNGFGWWRQWWVDVEFFLILFLLLFLVAVDLAGGSDGGWMW